MFEAPEPAFEALQPVVLMLPALDPVAQRALQVPYVVLNSTVGTYFDAVFTGKGPFSPHCRPSLASLGVPVEALGVLQLYVGRPYVYVLPQGKRPCFPINTASKRYKTALPRAPTSA